MAVTNPAKPGWATSEFWVTVATVVTNILQLSGLFPDGHLPTTWITFGTSVASAVAVGLYALSRAHVKVAAMSYTNRV